MLSVLHISDLHRSKSDPITNEELTATILADWDRLSAQESLPRPSIVVVSGDVIQGCPLGTERYEEEITQQYAEAARLLGRLAEEFLGGDRGRLVLVPGNHDVCWNTARRAMVAALPAEQAEARKLLRQPASPFRWNWHDRTLYRIADAGVYASRLDAFHRFMEAFFAGRAPDRIDEHATLQTIDSIDFVGLNSSASIDCYQDSGELPGPTIAKVALRLRGHHSLRVAVWHHSFDGPPDASDYLDQASIQRLAYHDFRLGFHGHQHRASAETVYVHTDTEEVMAIVSAGSLCAGRNDLPPGRLRGFNFVSIDHPARQARVFVRAMDLEARARPEYAFNGGSAQRALTWSPPRTTGAAASILRQAVLSAEAAINTHDPRTAASILLPVSASLDSYGRSLLFDSLIATSDVEALLRLFDSSATQEEAIRMIVTCLSAGRHETAEHLLTSYAGVIPGHIQAELHGRIRIARGDHNVGR